VQVAADVPQAHAGLGVPAYAQVTSPIRRYSDLLAHWQLKVRRGGRAGPCMPAAAALRARHNAARSGGRPAPAVRGRRSQGSAQHRTPGRRPHESERAAPAHLRGAAPPWGAPALAAAVDAHSAALRRLLGLEREVAAYWTAVYFRDAAAADPARTWPGLLLYWVRQARRRARARVKLLSAVFPFISGGEVRPAAAGGFAVGWCLMILPRGAPSTQQACSSPAREQLPLAVEQPPLAPALVRTPPHARARARRARGGAQETGVALVRLRDLGIETVVVINRPAAVGARLRLRCAAADPRQGHYRLEEAAGPAAP